MGDRPEPPSDEAGSAADALEQPVDPGSDNRSDTRKGARKDTDDAGAEHQQRDRYQPL